MNMKPLDDHIRLDPARLEQMIQVATAHAQERPTARIFRPALWAGSGAFAMAACVALALILSDAAPSFDQGASPTPIHRMADEEAVETVDFRDMLLWETLDAAV